MDFRAFGRQVCAVSAYFPDSTYKDAEVQKVYDQASEIIRGAQKNKSDIIFGADFNAKVGSGEDTAMHAAAGPHGLGEQNSRGQWLLTWASMHSLKIANTLFRKQPHKWVTHISSIGHENQLDYILVDNLTRGELRDVETNRSIDLGSDHTSLKATIEMHRKPKATKK